jgi:peptidoglycan/LPS O-acetylase OafA/YrhL
MDCLAFGVLAAQAVRYERTRRWLEANSMVPGYFALTLLPILAYLTLSRAAIQSLPMATFGYTTLGLFYTAVLLAVLYRKPGFLYWFCNTKPLVFVGGISYFIYLFQGVVGWMTFRAFGHDTISLCSLTDVSLFALSVIAIAGIGALSWILFESRLIDLGRNFRYQ